MAKKATIVMDVQTDKSVKNINDINNELNETVKVSKSLKTQLRAMTNELAELEPGTQRFKELSIAAGKLRDQIKDTSSVIQATAGSAVENLGSGFTKISGVGINAFQGIASAQALFGNESENLQKTLVKLQALAGLSEAVKGLGNLKDTMTEVKASFSAALQSSTLFNKATVAQAVATGQATTAQKIMNAVMKVNPIFLIIGAIIAAVAAYAYFSSSAEKAVNSQEALNATMEDYKKGATDAITKTNEVKVAFDLAKKGTISKKEALQTYNDTLGDTFGHASNLNEAEKLYNEKTSAYIKATALRAQAQALFALAAQESAKGVTASFEDQTGFFDKALIGLKLGLGDAKGAVNEFDKSQKAGVKEAEKNAAKRSNAYLKLGSDILKQAEDLENANGIISESEQKLNEKRDAEIKKANEKRLARLKEYNDSIIAFFDAQEKDRQDRIKDDQDKELQQLANKYDETTILADKAGQDLTSITEQYQKDIEAINKKYADKKIKDDNLKILENKKILAQTKLQEITNMRDLEILNSKSEAEKADAIAYYSTLIEAERKKVLDAQLAIDLAGIEGVENSESKKAEIIAKYNADIIASNQSVVDANKKDTEEQEKNTSGLTSENFKKIKSLGGALKLFSQSWKDDWAKTLETVVQGATQAVSAIANLFTQVREEQNARESDNIEKNSTKQSEALKAQLSDRLISQQEYDNQVKLMEQQKAQAELTLKRKIFEQEKRKNILSAIMNGAVSVSKSLAEFGLPFGLIPAGIAAGMTLAQVGIISSQQFRAARGGVVPGSGPSHIDSVSSLLAPGEFVINANSAKMFPELLSSINQAGGGISLAPKTSNLQPIPATTTSFQSQNQEPIRAFVVEQDITDKQKRANRLKNASRFG